MPSWPPSTCGPTAIPCEASRECYRALYDQLGPLAEDVHIAGLGVTGSGRQIAGLHAMTDGIINEIIAHAAAAVFFDPEVDTIFEIGGQDAKYTYHHPRRALGLCHERGLHRRHGILSRGGGAGVAQHRHGGDRRDRPCGQAPAQLQRPVRRLHQQRHQDGPSTRGSRGRTSSPGSSIRSA